MRKYLCLFGLILLTVSSSQAQEYVMAPVEHPGALHGQIVLNGTPPAPLQLLITKDAEICGEGYRTRTEYDVLATGQLRGVVVNLEGVSEGKAWEEATLGESINQQVCDFQPNVQVIQRGFVIDIINSDSTLHNIHGYELIGRSRRSIFNISQPEMGAIPQAINPVRGNQVSLECDSHDFMQGWIFVTDTPYATTVDENGQFSIGDIPPGSYRISTWHPKLGSLTQDVIIINEESSEVNFEYHIE